MTVIDVTAAVTAIGGRAAVQDGSVLIEYLYGADGIPSTRTDGSTALLPHAIRVPIVGGVPVFPVDVPPTDGTCYARVTIAAVKPYAPTPLVLTAVAIPSVGPVAISALVAVDPASFEPVTTVVTAWQLAVDQVAAMRTEVASKTSQAVEAAADAGTFAGATEFDANRAGQSAYQAGQSAATALGHKNDAKTSADAAAASAASIVKDVPGGVPTLDGNARVPDVRLPERLAPEALSITVAAQAEIGPAKGTAPAVSTRLNLGVPHVLPPIDSLTPAKSGTIPRVNINTVTGISNAVTWPVVADNTGAAIWSGPARVDTQTITAIPGCVIMQDTRNPATQGTAGIKWEFDTDAPNFVMDGVWGAGSILIYRDGELITDGAIGPVGNRYLRILAYEYSGFHHYEVFGGPGFGLANIITGPNDTVRRPVEPKPLVAFLTDSYGTTFSPIAGTTHIGLVGTLCRLMGWRPRTSIEGGSGYLTDGAGAAGTKFIDRVPVFDGVAVDALVLLGSRNDPTTGLTSAAVAVANRFLSTHPGVPIIMAGPWAPSASWETGGQGGNFAAIQAAAAAVGATYVDTRGIITGEGDITANPGVTGNGSRMIAGAHPTPPSPTDAAYVADGRQYHGYEFARRLTRKIGGY